MLRTTLLGSLLDAARHNLARGAPRPARCSRPAPSTARAGDRARCPTSTTRSARCSPARLRPPTWRDAGAAARRTSSPPRACSAALLDALRVDVGGRAGDASRSCTRAQRARAGRRRGRRLARRAAPARRRATWDLDDGAARVRARPRRVLAARRRGAALRGPDELPGGAPGPRGRRGRRRAGRAACSAIVRAAGGELLRRARASSTSTAASRWGRGATSLALRLAFRAPDRTLTDEEVAPAARARSSPRCATSWGASCVPERRSSLGAVGLRRRARGARCCTATRASSSRGHRAAPTPARALDDLYPRHRVPLTLEELDLERHGEVDAAIVAYPHGAAAPVVAALRERGVRVVDLSRRLPAARLAASTSSWYGAARGARAARRGRLRADRAAPRRRSRAPTLVANPGCYPDRGAARRSRRWRARG